MAGILNFVGYRLMPPTPNFDGARFRVEVSGAQTKLHTGRLPAQQRPGPGSAGSREKPPGGLEHLTLYKIVCRDLIASRIPPGQVLRSPVCSAWSLGS